MLSVSVYMQGGTPPLQLFTGSPHASVTFSDRLRKPSRAAQISVLSLPDYPLCLQACFCSFLFFFLQLFPLALFPLLPKHFLLPLHPLPFSPYIFHLCFARLAPQHFTSFHFVCSPLPSVFSSVLPFSPSVPDFFLI